MSTKKDEKIPYELMFDELPSLICCYKEEGEIVFVNKAYCRYFNKTRQELEGSSFLNLIPEGDREKARALIKSLGHEKPITSMEHKVINPDGSTGWQRWTDKACFDEDGKIIFYISIGEDITKAKKSELAYLASEKKYKLLFENSPAGILVGDVETREFTKSNPEICRMLGYTEAELLKLKVDDIHPKEELKKIIEVFEAQARGEKRVAENIPCLKKNGDIFYADIYTKSAVMDGRLSNIGFFVDITERKKLQEKIALSEKRLKEAQAVGRVGSWELNLKTKRLVWSDETFNIFGIKKDAEFTYDFLLNLVHPEDRDMVDKAWKGAFKGNPYHIVHRAVVDGKIKWIRQMAEVVFDREGNPNHAIGTVSDITELKNKSEELEDLEEKLQAIARSAQDAIIMIDENGDISFWNDAAENIFGYKKEEAAGFPVHKLLAPKNFHKKFEKGLENFKLTGKGQYIGNVVELMAVRKDGHKIPVEISLSSVKIGDSWNAVGIIRDISQRKKYEKEQKEIKKYLHQAQKMEAIGTLAGGIAHDFNNILSGIIGYGELAFCESESNPRLKNYVEQILKASDRAKNLVSQILTFSRKDETSLKPVQISAVVKDTINLVRASIPSSISIEPDIESSLIVMGDPVKIQQVVLNLCVNAAQAMETGYGTIGISLSDIDLSQNPELFTSIKKGRYIKLEISDTGKGIPENIIDSIFEPYFTTKERGKGTGLGLSVVHGIVKSYNGEIKVLSVKDQGTKFIVYLPAVDITDQKTEHGDFKEGDYLGKNEHILFVDDELPIVEIHKELLEMYGYIVTVRTNSIEALELIKKDPSRFDLIITDMTMPHMNGDLFAKEIKNLNPKLPVIICTGFGGGINEDDVKNCGVDGLLYKPVLKEKLLKSLRKLLD